MRFNLFNQYPELEYGLSEKHDGSMKIDGPDGLTQNNRQRFFAAVGFNYVISADLVHSTNVAVIVPGEGNSVIETTDALVTMVPNVLLSVTVADCFPVYFYDPKRRVVALAHAGWRGITGGIISRTLEKIFSLGSQKQDLLCAIGPGIQQHHFEVREDTLGSFRNYPEFVIRDGKTLVNLPGIINRQLLDLGLSSANIEAALECTYCQNGKYFSFRRDKPENVEAMAAFIGIKS